MINYISFNIIKQYYLFSYIFVIYSIVLMACCDANYRFLYVDVGTPGRWADGGTYDACTLASALENHNIGVPQDSKLPGKYIIVDQLNL